MPTVTLKYGNRLLFDCDTPFNEQFVSHVSADVNSPGLGEGKKQGLYSAKFNMTSSFTTGLIGSKAISAANLSLGDEATFWINSDRNLSAGDLRFLLDNSANCASPNERLALPELTANTWTRVSLPLDNPSLDTAIISIGFERTTNLGASHRLLIDDIGLTEQQSFAALSLRGFDTCDEVRFFPRIRHELVNGEFLWRAKAFSRVITANLGVVSTKLDRAFLLRWLMADATRQIIFKAEACEVVPDDVGWYANEWLDGIDFAKNYTIVAQEKEVRMPHDLPSSWFVT